MEGLRVLRFEVQDPFYNMALDEAIARSVGGGESPPTLRLYGWAQRAVSLGYFQEILEEVDLGFCREKGIEVVRRITGGGAVLHTEGELTYSFAVKDDGSYVPEDIEESYKRICSPIVACIRRLGAEAVFRPINDIEVAGKKVSGNAQTRRFGAVLQHGTLLLSIDYSMLRALRPRVEKLRDKGVSDVGGRVTTLKEILKFEPDRESVADILAEEFGKSLGLELRYGRITDKERELARDLVRKYRSEEWTFRR
ncbi:MAG: biotin/lipoate A/B protein ligase family protein [Candidatus Methanomethylicaceae archaeon]|nr:biotin/lipoate A/B protein ligase family protein [Candidatus Verstraetearchaeota archaeon]